MSLLSRLFPRTPEDPLGHGLWKQSHDRLMRVIDRFFATAEHLHQEHPDDPASALVAAQTHELNRLGEEITRLCRTGQARHPSEGTDLDGASRRAIGEVPRLLSRAGGQIAMASQAAAMARSAFTSGGEAMEPARSAERYVEIARATIAEASAILDGEDGY